MFSLHFKNKGCQISSRTIDFQIGDKSAARFIYKHSSCWPGMEGHQAKQESTHTSKGPLIKHSFYNSGEEQQQQQDTRLLTGGGRSCQGEDSPVSVIVAASKHLMQVSHPSSACASMDHPLHHHLHSILSSAPALPRRHHLFHFNTRISPSAHDESGANYAGSLSERVQQAFSKSHELMPAKTECNLHLEDVKSAVPSRSQLYNTKLMKPWANYVKGRMEWLNLQEDPPLTPHAIHSKAYVQSHTFASSPDDEAEGFSICSSGREQDEESVIDFFPSANRPSSATQLRRRSYDRVNEVGQKGSNYEKEEVKRVSLLNSSIKGNMQKRRSGGEHYYNDAAEELVEGGSVMKRGGPRVSCSSKWDEAERWLTNCSRSGAPPPPLLDLQYFSMLPKADKHVSENSHKGSLSGGSHGSTGARREAGTEMGSGSMRDMATQSTPTDWSRCDSPAETKAASPSTASLQEKGANKSSPPRHNTPARRSVSCSKQSAPKPCTAANGKLNLRELENCHLDKLKLARDLPLGTSSTWQLYPDEDTDHSLKLIEHNTPVYENSKNQQHAKVNMLEARVSAWEDVERAKHIAKFKREEAKIEAWESLQRAEADAELRKLEVKLEKLRFEGREKIMGRLGATQRRAQEMRDAAEAHKVEHLTRVGMRANHIRKSGHLPSSTFNVVCNLTTKIKTTSNLSFA